MPHFSSDAVYQIYVKSFADSNGDGIGDLPGIRSRLPYLSSLGVRYVWLTPFFVSPMRDNGYDVADYRAINPTFGTMEDFEALVVDARKLGIGIMADMVFNHTSTEHEWFRRALDGEEKYRDFYFFREGRPAVKGDAATPTPVAPEGPERTAPEGAPTRAGLEVPVAPDGTLAPTNWESKFGGPAWEYSEEAGAWYLHLFDRTQADLNWDNPAVREELKDIVRFWKAKGVEGFRFDVVNLVSKPETFEDDLEGDGRRFYTDGPHIHEYLHELVHDTGIADMVTVGEMSSTSLADCIGYSRPEREELSMVFSFHHLKVDYAGGDKWALAPVDFGELRRLLGTWQEEMARAGAWNALFLNNHDQPRAVSRFGSDTPGLRERSAKTLAMLIHLLRGTPYIYQGEEIGMTNAHFPSIGLYRDVESTNHFAIMRKRGLSEADAMAVLQARSRDNSRTPMQWTSGPNAGFTEGTPWLSLPGNHDEISVEACQSDPDSVLNFYRKLVRLRRELAVVAEGDVRFLDSGCDQVFGYERRLGQTRLVVACSLSEATVPVGGELAEALAEMSEAAVLVENGGVSRGVSEGDAAGAFTLEPFAGLALLDSDS